MDESRRMEIALHGIVRICNESPPRPSLDAIKAQALRGLHGDVPVVQTREVAS